MRKPKPPTPGSVSATLRYAGFRAIGDGDEGYEVTWHAADSSPAGGVRVKFHDWTESWAGSDALGLAAANEADALVKMAVALRHKGWQVAEPGGYLIVWAHREVARA